MRACPVLRSPVRVFSGLWQQRAQFYILKKEYSRSFTMPSGNYLFPYTIAVPGEDYWSVTGSVSGQLNANSQLTRALMGLWIFLHLMGRGVVENPPPPF